MSDLQILTNSRLKSFRACQRMHRYRYTLGYRPVQASEALEFGTAGHLCLQAYWEARKAGLAQPEWLAAALAKLPECGLDAFAETRLRVLLVGYAAAWDGEPIEVLAVEETFALPLINPETGAKSRTWQLGGKLDVLVRLADGRIAVIEHKTTSSDASEGTTYRERLTLDGQVSQYFDGADSLAQTYGFERAEVVVYDVLTKLSQRPYKATPPDERKYSKKTGELYANQRAADETREEYELRCMEAVAENPARYFQRAEVVRFESERDEYAFDVWQLGEAIRNSERTGKAPRNPDSCFAFGRPCDFWPVCSGRASLDDPTQYRKTDNVNEELAA